MESNSFQLAYQQYSKSDLLDIIHSSFIFRILELYILYLRPLFAPSVDPGYIFLNTKGKKFIDLGKCISQFFKETMELHITTTNIRSVKL